MVSVEARKAVFGLLDKKVHSGRHNLQEKLHPVLQDRLIILTRRFSVHKDRVKLTRFTNGNRYHQGNDLDAMGCIRMDREIRSDGDQPSARDDDEKSK